VKYEPPQDQQARKEAVSYSEMKAMRIENFSFGSLVINGKKYTSDLMIYPDGRVEDSWWRKSGHKLSSEDIIRLIESKPEVIVAGQGMSGLMRPERDLGNLLEQIGITFIAAPNEEAVQRFNELSSKKKIGACFHLTC
jgi:hypothetical protein